MNGLQIIDLKEATFMDRLLRREPRENAFLEINNLLAYVPILRIDPTAINDCLTRYEIPHEKAISRLTHFYTIIFKDFVRDYQLSNQQLKELEHLKHILSLRDQDINSIHSAIIFPIFQDRVRLLISDGRLTESEKDRLRTVAEQLNLPRRIAEKLYAAEAEKFLQSKLNQSVRDNMLSVEEELELEEYAKNLGVELNYSADARSNLDRYRFLSRLHKGELPMLHIPLKLEAGEFCSAYIRAEHFEIRRAGRTLKYSGYQNPQSFSGNEFYSGNFPHNPVSGNMLRRVGAGMLYFTNRRLLFEQSGRTIHLSLLQVIGATFYTNGLLIERQQGSDEFFKFSGDTESLRLIFNGLMTLSRK